jgi:hypothetical protein
MDSFPEAFENIFAEFNKQATETLNGLRQMQTIQHARLEEEAERLLQKFGQDRPRHSSVQVELSFSSKLCWRSELPTHVYKSILSLAGVEEPNFIVSGRVLDSDGGPAAGIMVTAYDRDVQYDDVLGSTLSDETGYFEIRFELTECAAVSLVLDEPGRVPQKTLCSTVIPVSRTSRMIALLTIRRGRRLFHPQMP